MKYEIGDKIIYKQIKRIETKCDKCGNIDTEYEDEEKEGVIENIKMEHVFNLQNGFIMEDEITNDESEKVVHKPYLSKEIKVIEKEPVYKINNIWHIKEAIIKKI